MDVIGLDAAFESGKVRRKTNNTRALRSKAARITKRCPEVLVKITSFGSLQAGGAKGKNLANFKAQIEYIARKGQIELETDRGDILRDQAALQDLISDWKADFASERRHKNQRDTMHMVLSMPEGTPEEAVRAAARQFARRVFKNHEYVFALHTPYTDPDPHPAAQPHVHLVVKMRGLNGRRLNPRKDDLHDWREAFAEAMRDEGVDAEASPRPLRGVVRKPERSVIRHIERGDQRRAPRVSRVRASKVKEVADELAAASRGEPVGAQPWEDRIKERQKTVRAAWLAAAAAIEQQTSHQKEQPNERPQYDKLDPRRVRAGQRAAAVYQSNLERSGLIAPTGAIARLRNLSRLDVVQRSQPAQVLLLAHAPDRLGRSGAADRDVRRPRAGAPGIAADPGGRAERVMGVERAQGADGGLAAQIRQFTAAMPPIDTERDALKRELAERFTRALDHARMLGVDPTGSVSRPSGSQLLPAPRAGNGVER